MTPSAIEAAAVAHDEAVLQCLSLLLDAHALPLNTNPAADNDDNGTFNSDALSRARMQAFLPITSGGLGLSNAQLASEPAYVAAWVDYLRFVHAHPSLFPSVHTLLTPASLATSSCPSIAARAIQLYAYESSLVGYLAATVTSETRLFGAFVA